MSISSLASLASTLSPIASGTTSTAAAKAGDFGSILKSAINEVENSHATADTSIRNFLSGENGEIHTTILATQKAELQFELFMQARNKAVSAYQEIMKMQL
ncbi:MAG: flagellar hook-basal body complex protein FliE [Bryobacteraceae bacterium]